MDRDKSVLLVIVAVAIVVLSILLMVTTAKIDSLEERIETLETEDVTIPQDRDTVFPRKEEQSQ